MPTYQYACTDTACGNRFELVQSFTDPAASACPVCAGPVRKVYGSVGVVFKGSGFYRTDSRAGSSASNGSSGSNGKSETKSDGAAKSDAPAAKSDSSSSSSSSSTSSSSSSSSSGAKSNSAPASKSA
jgi:putative FmdB family regulatory protein